MVMNAQEVFDTVATHLLKQNMRAIDMEGSCVYRSHDGLKCAVGCLIPDDIYEPGFESLGEIVVVIENCKELLADKASDWVTENLAPHFELLDDLQRVHDSDRPEAWPMALNRVARCHGLSNEVLIRSEKEKK